MLSKAVGIALTITLAMVFWPITLVLVLFVLAAAGSVE
jgi:hypothetical protein